MKKIIFILILFLSCYLIYYFTSTDKLYYLSIGDSLSKGINEYNMISYGYSDIVKDYLQNNNKLRGYNNSFTNKDYRITDLLRIIKYNEDIEIDDKSVSLNQLLKKADIITLSVGMNELYYKLSINNENIYFYVDEMLEDIKELLIHIDKFNHKKVFVLGYYNIKDKNQDIFNYANYKLRTIVLKEGFEFVDLDNIFSNNKEYFKNSLSFNPNFEGYKQISKIVIEKIENY